LGEIGLDGGGGGGADLRVGLSLGLVGLRDGEGKRVGYRSGLELARESGYRWVQLNAAAGETRPRDLGRSGVRDVAAASRRAGLLVSGVDLFVPMADFFDGSKVDRAAGALRDAVGFAGSLASLAGEGPGVLSTVLPRSDAAPGGRFDEAAGIVGSVVEEADRLGVVVADCGWPMEADRDWGGALGVGLDPAAVILHGREGGDGDGGQGGVGAGSGGVGGGKKSARETAGKALARVSGLGLLAAARVSDLTSAGRVEAGEGGLDMTGYVGALAASRWMTGGSVIGGGGRAVVVDLRGIVDGGGAAGRAVERLRIGL